MQNLKAGSAAPITKQDVTIAASAYGVDPALLAAFLSVECSWSPDGRLYGFMRDMTLTRRFEKHRFARYMPRSKRPGAAAAGLTASKWTPGQKGGPSIFAQAYAYDAHAALMASSFGLSQILGSNYKEAGFDSVEAMVAYLARSERHQLDATMRLMEKWGVLIEMKEGDYAGMARIWNGPKYAKHEYHTKLRDAHRRFMPVFARERHPRGNGIARRNAYRVPAQRSSVLKVGSKGKAVRELQIMLGVRPDSDFGLETKNAVIEFQRANNLKPDGVVGKNTARALQAARKKGK